MNFILIGIISLIFFIWLIVPIRQKNEKYFLFFLALISGDIATAIARLIFHSHTNIFYTISMLMCIIFVQKRNISKKFKILILILCIVSLSIELYGINYKEEFILQCFFNFLLFFNFIQNFIIKFVMEKIINIFLGFLVLYELTVITKYFGLITGFANARSYFIITSIFESLIGIFFCIFKERDTQILIKLK
jgi:hypothetical protein